MNRNDLIEQCKYLTKLIECVEYIEYTDKNFLASPAAVSVMKQEVLQVIQNNLKQLGIDDTPNGA